MRALVMCLALVAACGNVSAPPSATTGSGSATPTEQRVVSLTPSATEVMAALGATKMLVGVDDYSTYPPEVTSLPKVGSFMQPNLEAIVRLKPTLVIVDDVHGATAGSLKDAGVTTVECAMHALPDVKSALVSVGAKIGKSTEAEKVSHDIDAAIDAASAKRPAKRLRVLAIIDREAGGLGGLVAAGPGSWIDELLAIVGAENVLAASGIRYPKISREEVLRGKPDVIIDLSYPARTSTAEWNEVDVPAVKGHRVVGVADPFLVAPSPRVVEALTKLAALVDPNESFFDHADQPAPKK